MKNETVGTIASRVGGQVRGDTDIEIHEVADVRAATQGQISFIRDNSFAHLAADTNASALFVTAPIATKTAQIIVEDAHAAFAKIALFFHPVPRADEHSIDPTAVVHETAVLARPVVLGAHVVVGAGARIGSGTAVLAGTVIGDNVTIGSNCTVYSRVSVYDNVKIGNNVILHSGVVLGADGFGYVVEKNGTRNKFPQLGGLVIGDRVEIGANSTIDRGALNNTVIGSGTKIDNLCHIGHNCMIGEDCAIVALAALGGGTTLGDRVLLGGHVTTRDQITVHADVIIGGNSGITGDVTDAGVYQGLPLLPHRQAVKNLVLLKRLPQMATEIKALRRAIEDADKATDDDTPAT